MARTTVISIIDDDEFVREATKNLVGSLGYTVAVFANAEDFLKSPYRWDSSCLISDLHMPGMSGAELQDHLIAEGQYVPIIFITAFFDEKIRKRVLNAGAINFLRKPFHEDTLIACIEKALTSAPSRP